MKHVLPILKSIGVIVGFSATLWGVFRLVDTLQDNQQQDLQNHEVVLHRLATIENNIDSLYIIYRSRQGSEQEIKEMIKGTEGRLLYYIRHNEEMTNEQILDAFELGFEQGKKKELTASDLLGGIP